MKRYRRNSRGNGFLSPDRVSKLGKKLKKLEKKIKALEPEEEDKRKEY